jgi:hypothetical protein
MDWFYEIKLIILITAASFLFCAGCALEPVSSEMKTWHNKNPEFVTDIHGKLEVDARADGFPLEGRASWIKSDIISEIKYGKTKFIEDETGPEFRISFDEICTEVGKYPTNSDVLNALIHVGTLFLWPAHTDYLCGSTLRVVDPNTGDEIAHFHTEVKCQRGGFLLNYVNFFRNGTQEFRAISARRLFKQYQDSTQKTVNPQPR